MKKKDIYVDVKHLNYWWGIYNFTDLTSWEDLIIYEKRGRNFRKLAWTCICSSTYLKEGLNELMEDEAERDYINSIQKFLKGNKINYSYSYDSPKDDDFYEVPYEAKRNKLNIKPRYIETWYPCEGIDKNVIDKVSIDFCREFLQIEVDSINYKEIISKEKALISFIEFTAQIKKCTRNDFSDELVQQARKVWNIPEEKVLEILKRSLR